MFSNYSAPFEAIFKMGLPKPIKGLKKDARLHSFELK
jgi:hypothetical protein